MKCPKCSFDHAMQTTECLSCGIIFEKYARHQEAMQQASAPLQSVPEAPEESIAPSVDTTELKIRYFAFPIVLLLAWFIANSGMSFLLRTFVGMWIHEAGHAVTAWLCGFGAFPGPWFTPISEDKMITVTLAVAAGLGWGLYYSWRTQRWFLVAGFAIGLVLQLICYTRSHSDANALIIFGGDGGAMVLGTLLMTTLYVRRDSNIYRGALRWGFLVIGAGALMDGFTTWWHARKDYSLIPFGENEGVGLSDASRLADQYGWDVTSMVNRFVLLGIACFVFLSIAYVIGIIQERKRRDISDSIS